MELAMNHGIVPLGLIVLLILGSLQAAEVDQRPLPIGVEDAFPEVRIPRPVVLTHAGDGSRRIFVGSQLGEIHVFPKDTKTEDTEIFLDLRSKVVFQEIEDEEGLLGLAFHPKFKENGQFFVYYTTTAAPHTSVISRFRVSSAEPDRADPQSEEEILRIAQPFWNHNGGTLAFGPDGYLYIGLGDGGGTRDPQGHGQNLGTLHGSILRIDVDRTSGDLKYAIPHDNPFVDRPALGPKSGPTVCATSGGWHSIARPARCGPPTTAKICGRKSISLRAVAITAGTCAKDGTSSACTARRRGPT